MKIRFFIALLFAFQRVLSAQSPGAPPTWTPYIDSICSLEYPSAWRMDNSGDKGTQFILYTPPEDAKDNFLENISLVMSDMTAFADIPLDDIVSSSFAQLKQMIPGIQFITNKYAMREGLRVHIREFTGMNNGEQMHNLQHMMLVQGRLFILTFSATDEQYAHYQEEVQHVFTSFIPH